MHWVSWGCFKWVMPRKMPFSHEKYKYLIKICIFNWNNFVIRKSTICLTLMKVLNEKWLEKLAWFFFIKRLFVNIRSVLSAMVTCHARNWSDKNEQQSASLPAKISFFQSNKIWLVHINNILGHCTPSTFGLAFTSSSVTENKTRA